MATIYTTTLPADNNGDIGCCYRIVVPITGGAQDQVRATFKAGTASGWNTDHCSIGISTGTLDNTTTTPTELTFLGGAHGFNISASASITSDWINFAGFTSSNLLVVTMDINSGGSASVAWENSAGNGTFYFYTSPAAKYNVAIPGAATSTTPNISIGVLTIDTQANASITNLMPQILM